MISEHKYARAQRIAAALLLAILLLLPAGVSEQERPLVPAIDFTLTDQYGQEHSMESLKGKTVFLNFWATWCPWCVVEMPDIEALYHELGENQGDVAILGVAAPSSFDTATEEEIAAFLEEHECTYPVLMDQAGSLFVPYNASSLPTTVLIRPDGYVLGYIAGALSKEQMLDLIQRAQAAVEAEDGEGA